MENKPDFYDRQCVLVDMSCFGYPEGTVEGGFICGKTFEHVIDMWLIEFNHDFAPTYRYRVVAVPHTFIINNDKKC